ncbi:MAG: tetratricopeptide repeat protein [Candidatus Gastranaerophilales bacterium]|nr:tetratricopeptide repeat protein [Candidatus Gastranaerophilales bacterium]
MDEPNSAAGEITLKTYDARVEKVFEYLNNNDLDNAKIYLMKFITVEPNHPHACFIMGQILESEGNFMEAADYYERVYNPDMAPEFQQRVAMVFENADRYDLAYTVYKDLYAADPQNQDNIEVLAHACLILGKKEEAAEYYNKLLTITPDNDVALRQLAEIYEHTDKLMYHLTRARIFELEKSLNHMESEYKRALSLAQDEQDVLTVRYRLAKCYKDKKKFHNALDEYLAILGMTEENFNVFMELAEIYTELNNIDAAIEVLKRALKIYPDNKKAMTELADLLLETEHMFEAQQLYEKLHMAEPNNVSLNVNLAKAYLKQSKKEETKRVLLETEKLQPDDNEVLTALAGFYSLEEDFDEAQKYCERIIKKLPNSPLGYRKLAQMYELKGDNSKAHYNFGLYHQLKGEIQDAIDEFTWAVHYDDKDYQAIKKLANLQAQGEEKYQALDFYERLAEHEPDREFAVKEASKIHIAQKEYDLAHLKLQSILDEGTKDFEFYLLNADCLYQMKDFDAALENYKYYDENSNLCTDDEHVKSRIKQLESHVQNPYENNLLSKILKFFDKEEA